MKTKPIKRQRYPSSVPSLNQLWDLIETLPEADDYQRYAEIIISTYRAWFQTANVYFYAYDPAADQTYAESPPALLSGEKLTPSEIIKLKNPLLRRLLARPNKEVRILEEELTGNRGPLWRYQQEQLKPLDIHNEVAARIVADPNLVAFLGFRFSKKKLPAKSIELIRRSLPFLRSVLLRIYHTKRAERMTEKEIIPKIPEQGISDLTNTEVQVLDQLTTGSADAEIAQQQSKSVRTIHKQVRSATHKLDCRNRTEAALTWQAIKIFRYDDT